MIFDPKIHHRKSIRLKNYDYSQAGLYFITICTENRLHLFGEIVDDSMVLVPSPEEVELMTNEIQPLIDKQITNSKQIRTLQSLRDTLLPKLMSGEVRVVIPTQSMGTSDKEAN